MNLIYNLHTNFYKLSFLRNYNNEYQNMFITYTQIGDTKYINYCAFIITIIVYKFWIKNKWQIKIRMYLLTLYLHYQTYNNTYIYRKTQLYINNNYYLNEFIFVKIKIYIT